MDLLTYLRCCEPEELVSAGGNTYATRSHDSLKISNGKWYWWSRGVGGSNALDYLTTVRELPLPEAGLEDIFRRHISETAYADQLPWTLGQRLYMLKPTVFGGYNRFKGDETIQSYLAQQDAAGDVTSLTLGVLDPAAHKAYLLRYDD